MIEAKVTSSFPAEKKRRTQSRVRKSHQPDKQVGKLPHD